MKKIFFQFIGLAAFLLIGVQASAQQKDARPGYYLDRNGERHDGYFAARISQRELKGIWFRSEPDHARKKVALEEISRIVLDEGEQYLIYEFPGPGRLEQLILKKVVDGPVSLYRGNASGKGTVFYWESEGADASLLISRDNFTGSAKTIGLRCPDIDPAGYKFNQRDLTEMVVAYNACRNPGAETMVLEEAQPFRFNIGVRPYWYTANLSQPSTAYYGRGDYSGEAGFSGALSLAWMVNARLRVLMEPSYASVRSTSDYVNVPPYSDERTFSRVTFEINNLELPLLVQYGFPLGRLRPFAEGGLFIGIPLSTGFQDDLTPSDPSNIRFQPSSVTFDETSFGYTVGTGLGWVMNPTWQLELLGRWTQSTSLMRVETDFNQGGTLFHNFLINKVEVGLRLWWMGK